MSIVTGRRGLVAFIAAACTGVSLLGGASSAAPLSTSASSSATQAPSTSLTISRPASAGSGTVLLATVAFRADAAAPLTAPAGWSQVVRTSCVFGATVLTQATFVRVAAASEPAAYTFSTGNPTGRRRLDLGVHGYRPRAAGAGERGCVHAEHEGGEPGAHDERRADAGRGCVLAQRHRNDHEPAGDDEPFGRSHRRQLADRGRS